MEKTNTVSGGDPNYLKLLDDMRELHIKKNAGYSGDSQDRDLASYSLIAICILKEGKKK